MSGIFSLIANEGALDRMLLATAMLEERIKWMRPVPRPATHTLPAWQIERVQFGHQLSAIARIIPDICFIIVDYAGSQHEDALEKIHNAGGLFSRCRIFGLDSRKTNVCEVVSSICKFAEYPRRRIGRFERVPITSIVDLLNASCRYDFDSPESAQKWLLDQFYRVILIVWYDGKI